MTSPRSVLAASEHCVPNGRGIPADVERWTNLGRAARARAGEARAEDIWRKMAKGYPPSPFHVPIRNKPGTSIGHLPFRRPFNRE